MSTHTDHCELYASSLVYRGSRIDLCREGTASANGVAHALRYLRKSLPGYCLHVVFPDPGREQGKREKWLARRPTYVVALEHPMHALDARNLWRMGLSVLYGDQPGDLLNAFMAYHDDDDYFEPKEPTK